MSNLLIRVGDLVWLPTPLHDRPDSVSPALREQALALEAEITGEPGRVVSIEDGWAMVDRGSWGQFGYRVEDLGLATICPECKVDLAKVDEHDEGCNTGAQDHCYHRTRLSDEDDWDLGDDDDYCVHCECCCTCFGCEYGPRDGLIAAESATPEQTAVLATIREEVNE